MYVASSEAASQRILAGIKTAWSTSFSDLNFQDFLLTALCWECYTRHTHKARGGGGGGAFVVNSWGLLPWTCHHIARVRPQRWSCLKSVHMWLLDTNAEIPWDSVRSSFKYNQARLIPLHTALSGPVSRDSGVEPPMTSLTYLPCAMCRHLVVILQSCLYLAKLNGFAAMPSLLIRFITFVH